MIQELRVTGGVAGGTEVVHAAHQSLAKEMVPDAVDHHPGSQGVARADNPFSHLLSPTAAPVEEGLEIGVYDGNKTAANPFARLINFSPFQKSGFAHKAAVTHAHGPRNGLTILGVATQPLLKITDPTAGNADTKLGALNVAGTIPPFPPSLGNEFIAGLHAFGQRFFQSGTFGCAQGFPVTFSSFCRQIQ